MTRIDAILSRSDRHDWRRALRRGIACALLAKLAALVLLHDAFFSAADRPAMTAARVGRHLLLDAPFDAAATDPQDNRD
jgi:hypothetical protein